MSLKYRPSRSENSPSRQNSRMHRLVFAQQAEIGHDQFDCHDVIAVLVVAFDGRLDALLEIGDQISGIAAENLVSALPAENALLHACAASCDTMYCGNEPGPATGKSRC